MSHPSMRPLRSRHSLLTRTARIAVALILVGSVGHAGSPADPVPVFDVGGGEKHFHATVAFSERETASLSSAEVEFGFARGSAGNPPLLRVRVLDADGQLLQEFDEWHPLWELRWNDVGEESLEVLTDGEGTFFFPFDPDAAVLSMTDVELDQEVLTGDLTEAVHSFCEAHPEDADCELADFQVSGVGALAPPPLFLLGQPEALAVRTTVENTGPDGPIHARVIRSTSTSAGLSISPMEELEDERTLDVGAPTNLDGAYVLECLAPGLQLATFTSRIEPVRAATVDPDPTNDEASLAFSVDCAVPVAINVKPGGGNPIQLRRSAGIPVAILSTAQGEYALPLGFDATSIDPLTVRFGSRTSVSTGTGAAEVHRRGHPEDALELDEVTLDGDLDLLLHFRSAGTGLGATDTMACARGTFAGALTFFGCDAVRAVP